MLVRSKSARSLHSGAETTCNTFDVGQKTLDDCSQVKNVHLCNTSDTSVSMHTGSRQKHVRLAVHAISSCTATSFLKTPSLSRDTNPFLVGALHGSFSFYNAHILTAYLQAFFFFFYLSSVYIVYGGSFLKLLKYTAKIKKIR